MKRRRICWLGLAVPLGAAVAPFLLWALIVLIAPTNWARSHVVRRLERSSGRSVQIDQLNVCLLGGIDLAGLRIGAPGSGDDPWLEASKLHIDVSVFQLLCGSFSPSLIDVEGGTLRVVRRDDGSLELADLVHPSRVNPGRSRVEPHECGPSKLKVKVSQFQITLVDHPTQSHVILNDVSGEANCEGEGALAATFCGLMNKGPFQFTAHFDQAGGKPSFEGQFNAMDVVVDQDMGLLRYLVPVLAGATGQLHGNLGIDVYLRGEGLNRAQLTQSLVGQGRIELDPISLTGTPLVAELSRVLSRPPGEKLASLRSQFVIDSGRISTDNLDLELGKVPVAVSGWTDFDGRLDYQIKVDKLERISERLEEKARKYLSGLDLDLKSLTRARMTGSVERVAISLNPGANGRSTVDDVLSPADRDKLRLIGKRLKDQLLR